MKGFGYFALAFALLVGFVFVAAWSILPTRTPQDIVNKTFDADNVLTTYEQFRDVDNQYLARVAQVKQFKTLYGSEQNPEERARLRMEMAAQQQSCRELVAIYNSNSEKANRNIFKLGGGMPIRLDLETCS